MIKAIFFDIDGTLVSFKTHRIPQSTLDAIHEVRKQGIKIFIATGRPLPFVNNLDGLEYDGVLSVNGACFVSNDGTKNFSTTVDKTDVQRMIEHQRNSNMAVCYATNEKAFAFGVNDAFREVFEILDLEIPEILPPEEALKMDITQIIAFFTENEHNYVMSDILPGCQSLRWHPAFADCIMAGTDKAKGIDRVCELYGFRIDEVMAFGDGGNDREMLSHVGCGVAMGNASDEVKKYANYVTDTVDNDGIAKALNKLLLRPLILISNDDGYQAKGINALADMVREFGDVFVVAPDVPRSGAGMSISAHSPVRNKLIHHEEADGNKGALTVWSCSGTPDDCVKMAFEVLLPHRPVLVLGGINHGNNCAINAHYSGTVSIVMEGCMKGVPSVAFSFGDMASDADFEPMRPYVQHIVRHVLKHGLPANVCLNVNAPTIEGKYKGMKVQRMGMGDWCEEWKESIHPHGWKYYWIAGYYSPIDGDDQTTDTWAYENGYVAITPLQLDMTAHAAITELNTLNL